MAIDRPVGLGVHHLMDELSAAGWMGGPSVHWLPPAALGSYTVAWP